MIKAYKIYYYAEGEEVNMGYYTDFAAFRRLQEKWKGLRLYYDEIEINDLSCGGEL